MRVTNGMLITNMMRNYKRNLNRIENYQEQLASGKSIRRPSDDPSGASKALKLRSDLSMNEQYIKNADNALSWLNITETALRDIGDTLQRARELTVQAANGTFTPENRAVIADEIEQLQQHILQVSNSTYAGRYIFGGFRTDMPAFVYDPNPTPHLDFQGNEGEIAFEVGIGSRIPVNVTGGTSGVDIAGLYATLEDLKSDLRNTAMPSVDTYLTDIDSFARQALAHRSAVGAKTNRFEMIRARLLDSEVNFTELLSKTQDADIAEVVMHLKEAEAVYNASLATGARIIMPTLVDFLR
jgi:flagellar hook-associated protein 3 FlgL